jgi:hypothetical protein
LDKYLRTAFRRAPALFEAASLLPFQFLPMRIKAQRPGAAAQYQYDEGSYEN